MISRSSKRSDAVMVIMVLKVVISTGWKRWKWRWRGGCRRKEDRAVMIKCIHIRIRARYHKIWHGHTHTHLYVYIYFYISIFLYIHTRIPFDVYVHALARPWVRVCIHTCVYLCMWSVAQLSVDRPLVRAQKLQEAGNNVCCILYVFTFTHMHDTYDTCGGTKTWLSTYACTCQCQCQCQWALNVQVQFILYVHLDCVELKHQNEGWVSKP